MDEKPRRRWFQFSLSSMLMLVVVCAVAASVGPQVANWLFPPEFSDAPAIIPPLQLWNPDDPRIQRWKKRDAKEKPIPIYENPYRAPQAATLS